MQTIRYPKSNFDDAARFSVQYTSRITRSTFNLTCYLFCSAWHEEFTGNDFYGRDPAAPNHNKVFCVQGATMIKAHYTEADKQNRAALNAMEPLKNGDIVEIEGKGQYQFKLYGDYSNAGEFVKVGE